MQKKVFKIHFFEVLHGSSLAFLLRGLGAGLVFSVNVVIGRLLGAEGAGIYFIALSVINMLAVVAKIGLDNALLRFIAAATNTNDSGKVRSFFRAGMRMAVVASAVTVGLVLAVAPWIAKQFSEEPSLVPSLQIMSLGIFTFSMMTLLAECLKGVKHVRNSMLVSGVFYPAIMLVIIWPLTDAIGTIGAGFSYVLSTGVAALIGLWMWRKVEPRVTTENAFCVDPVVLWRACRPLWVMSIINRGVLPWAPLLMLGLWAEAAEVGIFGAANAGSYVGYIFPDSA